MCLSNITKATTTNRIRHTRVNRWSFFCIKIYWGKNPDWIVERVFGVGFAFYFVLFGAFSIRQSPPVRSFYRSIWEICCRQAEIHSIDSVQDLMVDFFFFYIFQIETDNTLSTGTRKNSMLAAAMFNISNVQCWWCYRFCLLSVYWTRFKYSSVSK